MFDPGLRPVRQQHNTLPFFIFSQNEWVIKVLIIITILFYYLDFIFRVISDP